MQHIPYSSDSALPLLTADAAGLGPTAWLAGRVARMPTLWCTTVSRPRDGSLQGNVVSMHLFNPGSDVRQSLRLQVPLNGEKWDRIILPQHAFNPQMLLSQLQENGIRVRVAWEESLHMYTESGIPLLCMQVGLVIDLTNSDKYYHFDDEGASDFQYRDGGAEIFHRKVCQNFRALPEMLARGCFSLPNASCLRGMHHVAD